MKEFLDFYDKVKSNYIHIININPVKFIIKEITWKDGLLIDAKSFRKKDNVIYQNTEFEKREILSIAILCAYDSEENKIYYPEFEKSLIDILDHTIVEKLWNINSIYIFLLMKQIFITFQQKNILIQMITKLTQFHPLLLKSIIC